MGPRPGDRPRPEAARLRGGVAYCCASAMNDALHVVPEAKVTST